jgi:ATP-dependent RNA helicase DeaD
MNEHSAALAVPSSENIPSDFSGLEHPQLLDGLKRMGISTPTPVQARSLLSILGGRDHIIEAQTGSGKTLAFLLPILKKLIESPNHEGNFALIITPTRELAVQVNSIVAQLLPDIQPACIIGGEKQEIQIKQLRRDPRVVVGTPGRIIDLIEQRELLLRRCRMFVLDEADEMLSMGFIDDIRKILARLPASRQGLFFSATITPRVLALANSFLKSPSRIEITRAVEAAPKIEHVFCRVDGSITAKAEALARYLKQSPPRSAIVFCNTKSDTELVEILLKKRGFEPKRLNSDLSQRDRDRTMASFRSGELKILVATDVAARGIDVSDVDLVVNYSLHDTTETYVHRTGRTGRAGRSGTALSLVGPQDFSAFHNLSRKLDAPLAEITISETVA